MTTKASSIVISLRDALSLSYALFATYFVLGVLGRTMNMFYHTVMPVTLGLVMGRVMARRKHLRQMAISDLGSVALMCVLTMPVGYHAGQFMTSDHPVSCGMLAFAAFLPGLFDTSVRRMLVLVGPEMFLVLALVTSHLFSPDESFPILETLTSTLVVMALLNVRIPSSRTSS